MVSKKEKEENISKKKERKVTIDGLKSLSSQNLVKIEQNDDILKNEINEGENNSSNNLNNLKKLEDELYDNIENDNSMEDYESEEEEKETEEEKKNKELMVSNNMKKVFIDSR